MTQGGSQLKVGVYVDVANLAMNGGFGMRYDVLREFACRGSAEPIRLNAYVSFDPERARTDKDYRNKQLRFHAALRDLGYKVIQKEVKWYTDEDGNRFAKSNVDLDLAVDALLQSDHLDRVILATGDGDFVQVIRALQNRGCRVEVVAFDNVSGDLRREADLFMSGYLLPNLLPIKRGKDEAEWGELDSFVRGVCYNFDERGFGFIRHLDKVDGEIWRTDSRDRHSPYRSTFFHGNQVSGKWANSRLNDRQTILEFRLVKGDKEGQTKAQDIEVFQALT